MLNSSIRDRCFVNQNRDADTFVGLKCENGEFSVHFPLGFGISENDKELRKDIILLLDTIASTTGKKDSSIYNLAKDYNYTAFPIQAYISIIKDLPHLRIPVITLINPLFFLFINFSK